MPTYYTTHNAGGGGVGSFVAPWTLQEAADSAVAGDTVYICNTGTYSSAARTDFDTNSGTIATRASVRVFGKLKTISGASGWRGQQGGSSAGTVAARFSPRHENGRKSGAPRPC